MYGCLREKTSVFFEGLITNLLCAYEVFKSTKIAFCYKEIIFIVLSLIFENLKPNKIDYFSPFFIFKIFISEKKEL